MDRALEYATPVRRAAPWRQSPGLCVLVGLALVSSGPSFVCMGVVPPYYAEWLMYLATATAAFQGVLLLIGLVVVERHQEMALGWRVLIIVSLVLIGAFDAVLALGAYAMQFNSC